MTDIDRATFREEVRAAGRRLSPFRAGLLFAREIAYPGLRPSQALLQLEGLVEGARRALQPHAGAEARGLALAEFLFQAQDFRGDTQDYTDPRNSYLNDLLARRRGIPISLSVLMLEIAARLELPVVGVGLPGHFVVALMGGAAPVYLDPFNRGARLTVDDCARLVRQASGYRGAFEARWLAPTPRRAIVERMLNNLRNFYTQVEDWSMAVRVVECLRDLRPEVKSHLRDLGLLHYRQGALGAASDFLSQYLLAEPDAPDHDSVRQSRDVLVEHLARLN